MKYFKKSKFSFSKLYLIVFITLISILSYINKDLIYRSAVTINLGSLYVNLLNEKAEIINLFNSNNIENVSISMSSNNYVRLQQERSKMVTGYVTYGEQWKGENKYFKSKYAKDGVKSDSKIKLFGMNPDHFRSSVGHSFRLLHDGGVGLGKKKVNYLNIRSRDFITDPLLNMIYSKLFDGIKISYRPERVSINKNNYGIFFREDFFDSFLIEENNRRDSVIFEIINDSLQFNHLGEDDIFEGLGLQLSQIYLNEYDEFVNLVDIDKLKAVIYLSILTNDNHPLSDINMHWYFNPVSGLLEPTIREAFVKQLDSLDIKNVISSNKLIFDVLKDKIDLEFKRNLIDNIIQIDSLIINDHEYNSLKESLIGYRSQINEKEKIFRNNIEFLIENLEINEQRNISKTETFHIKNDTIIYDNMTISKNTNLIIDEGVKIELSNSLLKVYGGFKAIGSKKNPIKIFGSEDGSGTIFINTIEPIELSHVKFNYLTNSFTKFSQPASLIFYECNNISINNSTFENNLSGDDYINFFRSKNIVITNSIFKNVKNDAIDSDFSDLLVENTTFENIGNDGIDGSGSNVKIKSSKFYNILDKAVSAGEQSNFYLNKNLFENNEIAIVVKDDSKLISEEDILVSNRLDFVAFRKKRFFELPSADLSLTNIKNYLIEHSTKVIGLENIEYSSDIEEKLYGNIYGRASN
ncbi:MAG: right-handed parallel beta-helix repeat-containing protein [Flavobacteriaceae bacterium]|jgi:hypothetical protein|nr:right-handed parallel beta-helix repeat-containing protein [Flavobacteriaceae bacterium]MBT6448083.1 right-handed parallel beta-helix repeat-containing protein [Flavobacteriaceae bacterium]